MQSVKNEQGTDVSEFQDDDYYKFVDGKPRESGIRSFLASRHIQVNERSPDDPENSNTVRELSNKKESLFLKALQEEDVMVYESTVDVIRQLKDYDVKIGLASSSKNARLIIQCAKLENLFEAIVDGNTIAELNLQGKPSGDMFVKCAEMLGFGPKESIVVEDAVSGIQAAVDGGFALALGIDRTGHRYLQQRREFPLQPLHLGINITVDETSCELSNFSFTHSTTRKDLLEAGAHMVIRDFSEISIWQMNDHFPHKPSWVLSYNGFVPAKERLRESLCSLGNGLFASRAAQPWVTEREHAYPGTYMSGGYNKMPSKVKDKVVYNEDLVNLPNWLYINFRPAGGSWLDLEATHHIIFYEQHLNLEESSLVRRLRVQDPEGRITTIVSQMCSHMKKPQYGTVHISLTPENWSGTIEIESKIDGSVRNHGVARYLGLTDKHFCVVRTGLVGHSPDEGVYMLIKFVQARTEITMASNTKIYMHHKHILSMPVIIKEEEKIGQRFTVNVSEGAITEIEKFLAGHSSKDRGISESSADACADIQRIRGKRIINLIALHQLSWRAMWFRSDISVTLDTGIAGNKQMNGYCMSEEKWLNLILRFHAFHLMQVGCQNILGRDVSIPARGLSGESYRGHIFWDELFILPFYHLRFPEVSRAALLYRSFRLEAARTHAKHLGCFGACFPWQSGSNGSEESQIMHLNPRSGQWEPDRSRLQYHVNCAIFYNIWNYFDITGDLFYLEWYGAEILLEIARFWGHFTKFNNITNRYEILGVMGPDEFHEAYPGSEKGGLCNNAYTNVMVVWCLKKALHVLAKVLKSRRRLELMDSLHITDLELRKWEHITKRMTVPFMDGIIEQFDGWDQLKELDFEAYRAKYGNISRMDRILRAEGDSPDNYKVSKQADVTMLFYLMRPEELSQIMKELGYTLTTGMIKKNIDYYEARCTHGSTLSQTIYSAIYHPYDIEKSWKFFCDFIQSDVEDRQHGTTEEGIHMGSMAASINVLLSQYGGIDTASQKALTFRPHLPPVIKDLKYRAQYQGQWVNVHLSHKVLKIGVDEEDIEPVAIVFKGLLYQLQPGTTTEFDI